jgi:hypothetical protein
MCNPGQECASVLRNAAVKAVEKYRKTGTQEAKQKMVLAVLLHDSTPSGIRRLERKAADTSTPWEARELAQKRADAGRKYLIEKKRAWMRAEWLHLDGMDPLWRGDEKTRPKISNPMVAKAYVLAVNAHAGAMRKNGEPYINHPLRTAKRIQDAVYEPEAVAIALLHDVVEDSDLELSDLRAMGFCPRVISGVDAVTKRSGELYSEAVKRASLHPDARFVKLSDNLDNSCPGQLACFTEEKKQKQLRKYAPAREVLMHAITGKTSACEPEFIFTKTYRLSIAA